MEKSIKKEYKNGEFTIVWQPVKCIHAGVCTRMLPQVYNPNERPWIKADQATHDQLKEQIDQCPSGALSYYIAGQETAEESNKSVKVAVMPKGPLLVTGSLEVKDKDGNVEMKEKTTAFCRCGASSNKPYCDGSHNGINFDD